MRTHLYVACKSREHVQRKCAKPDVLREIVTHCVNSAHVSAANVTSHFRFKLCPLSFFDKNCDVKSRATGYRADELVSHKRYEPRYQGQLMQDVGQSRDSCAAQSDVYRRSLLWYTDRMGMLICLSQSFFDTFFKLADECA